MTSDPLERYLAQRAAQTNGLSRRVRLKRLECVDLTVNAFRSLGWGILWKTALPALYCWTVIHFTFDYVLADFFTTKAGTAVQAQLQETLFKLGLAFFVGLPLLLVGVAYVSAVASAMVGDWVAGVIPNANVAAAEARRKLPKAIAVVALEVATVSPAFIIAAACLFFSAFGGALFGKTDAEIPAIQALFGFLGIVIGFLISTYRWVSSALVVPVIMNEDVPTHKASTRSRSLLRIKVFDRSGDAAISNLMGTLFLVELALSAGLATLIEAFAGMGLVASSIRTTGSSPVAIVLDLISGFVLIWIVITFGAIGRAIVYFDRRIRIEGYDIELMARSSWQKQGGARFEI